MLAWGDLDTQDPEKFGVLLCASKTALFCCAVLCCAELYAYIHYASTQYA